MAPLPCARGRSVSSGYCFPCNASFSYQRSGKLARDETGEPVNYGKRRFWRSVRREEGIRLVAVGHGSNMESRVSDRGADRIQRGEGRHAPDEVPSKRFAELV
jgi:hypothetical protein